MSHRSPCSAPRFALCVERMYWVRSISETLLSHRNHYVDVGGNPNVNIMSTHAVTVMKDRTACANALRTSPFEPCPAFERARRAEPCRKTPNAAVQRYATGLSPHAPGRFDRRVPSSQPELKESSRQGRSEDEFHASRLIANRSTFRLSWLL